MPPPGAPRPLGSYSFSAISLVIGNIFVSNYDPEGTIQFEYPGDQVESDVSADGFVVYSWMADDRVKCTITLSQKSGSLPQVQALATSIRTVCMAGGQIVPAGFLMNDPSTGDQIFSEYVVVLNEGTPTKGKKAGTRTIVMELPYARYRQIVGANNLAF